MTKAELIQLAFNHLPPKEFIVDKIANKYDIEIVRIPVKHCVPIAVPSTGLKAAWGEGITDRLAGGI